MPTPDADASIVEGADPSPRSEKTLVDIQPHSKASRVLFLRLKPAVTASF
jgi:hypothetical protein